LNYIFENKTMFNKCIELIKLVLQHIYNNK